MANTVQQLRNELKDTQLLMEQLEKWWQSGSINEDGDYVIPDEAATEINLILEY